MEKRQRHALPDDFELGIVPFDPSVVVEVPNYHPLEVSEIERLLQRSLQCPQEETNDILKRLIQGIRGMVSPIPVEGIIAEKATYLSGLFLTLPERPELHKRVALQMHHIMNYDD